MTDSLQSGREGAGEISLSPSQSFSEILEHCHWNAVLASEIIRRDGIVICELMQTGLIYLLCEHWCHTPRLKTSLKFEAGLLLQVVESDDIQRSLLT